LRLLQQKLYLNEWEHLKLQRDWTPLPGAELSLRCYPEWKIIIFIVSHRHKHPNQHYCRSFQKRHLAFKLYCPANMLSLLNVK
jgi:hypothetical protein